MLRGLISSIIFINFLIVQFYINCTTKWTVLVYMEPSGDLTEMVFKNIADMCLGEPNSNVCLLIQLHAYENIAIRYKIENKSLITIEKIILTDKPALDLIKASKWAFKTYPSDNTMLILWSHGFGILDPKWNKHEKKWLIDSDDEYCHSCEQQTKKIIDYLDHNLHKGFMFNNINNKYLNNKDMVKAFKKITKAINKKIDVIGFDTCLGAMAEISFQIAPYANYQISCQNCELKDGWDYRALSNALNHEFDPKQISKLIIKDFDKYHKENTKCTSYTQSVVALESMTKIINKLDSLIAAIMNTDLDKSEIKKIIIKAREECPRFCYIPMYTDLISFVNLLSQKLINEQKYNPIISQAINELLGEIKNGIIANCTGINMQNKAHGISIYFPKSYIDRSYYKTRFAFESKWLDFLNFLIN